jgi:DNA replication and repair protein RecF
VQLVRLEVYNFRNLRKLRFSPHPRTSVISGPNGSGKTNVLEAINLVANLRSHRVALDRDMVMKGEDAFAVHLYIERAGVEEHLKLEYLHKKAQKRAYKDNKKVARLSDFVADFKVILFTPEDLVSIRSSPSTRRDLIDVWISKVRPSYIKILNRYNNILRQRNALLKDISFNRDKGVEQLKVWTERLVDVGSEIVSMRSWAVRLLSEIAEDFYKKLSPHGEEFKLEYRSDIGIESENTDEVSEGFFERIDELREREFDRGITLCGPQRDDIAFLLNGREADLYASQGQTRLMAFAFRLSEHKVMEEIIGEVPLFLLDDLNSELDAERLEFAFRLLPTIGQVILTTTDENIVSKVRGGEMDVFHIEDGVLVE